MCPTCGAGYGPEALFCPRDGAPLAARKPDGAGDPYLGLSVEGRFALEKLVGIGAMSRVYRAHQAGIERAVAVKVLHREHAKNPTLVARFHREARVAGGLSHPNVVQVFVDGELPRGTGRTDGEPYLVMEFLDGLSLRSALVAAGGRLSLERALSIVLQIADALGEAHTRAIVHRDVKPENVMLVPCGASPDFVKVLDFGVARVGEGDSSLATHEGAVLGTAAYACPETARGDRVGPSGDVYSLATVLFECLSGRPPFSGKSPVDVLIQHAQAAPPDLRDAGGTDVPTGIARVVAENLRKSPNERAADAWTFGRALFAAARESGLDPDRLVARSTLFGLAERGRMTSSVKTTSPGSSSLRPVPAQGGRRP